MKSRTHLIAWICLAFIAFYGCKKNSNEDQTSLDTQYRQFNSDANYYKSESDQADNDINNKLSDFPAFGKGVPLHNTVFSSPLCGVTIDTSQISNKILFFNFDSITPCFSPSRTRSGQIKVQLTTGTHWSDPGSVLTITYINFRVTRLSDNRSVKFNGVKTLTNVNGNDWIGFLAGTATLKYKERAFNIAVSFDNGSNATWNSARITEWSYVHADGTIPYDRVNFTSNGDTAVSGYSHVDVWGVNRFGQSFTTQVTTPIVSNTYCGLWRFNSGQVVHHVNGRDYTLTLGVDQNGNPTPYACAYGFKVSWTTLSGGTQTVVLSY